METLLSKASHSDELVDRIHHVDIHCPRTRNGDYLTCGGDEGEVYLSGSEVQHGRNFLNGRLGCCRISLSQHHSFEKRPPTLILVPITKALGSDRVANLWRKMLAVTLKVTEG